MPCFHLHCQIYRYDYTFVTIQHYVIIAFSFIRRCVPYFSDRSFLSKRGKMLGLICDGDYARYIWAFKLNDTKYVAQ